VDVLKRFFALVFVGIIAFSLAVIGFAHPGKTDGDGGHYNHDTGEYHYHHGYSAHQHPNGVCPYVSENTTDDTEKDRHNSSWYCVSIDNLEDVLCNEFGGERGEDMRDILLTDAEVIASTYVEYNSLWDVAMRQYEEDVADRILSHPDLILLTPEDVMDSPTDECEDEYDDEEDEDPVIGEYNVSEDEEEKSFFDYDVNKKSLAIFGIILGGYTLLCVVGYFKEKKKAK
jgi:hypothetical protein